MEKKDIILNILSKDQTKISEAKQAIKDILTARATQFRTDATKFVGRKLFENFDYTKHTKPGDKSIKHAEELDRVEIDNHAHSLHGHKGTILEPGETHHKVALDNGDDIHVKHSDLKHEKKHFSESTVNETHTLNGPFPKGTVVHDSLIGKVGVVAPTTSGHLATVHFPDHDPANYGPGDVHRLKQHDNEDNLPDAIAALKGLFANKG